MDNVKIGFIFAMQICDVLEAIGSEFSNLEA
jgi:hypothetical protein